MEGPFHGYCAKHFNEAFGISYGQYKKHKTARGENPANVAERIREMELQAAEERVRKAKEGIEPACEEHRERHETEKSEQKPSESEPKPGKVEPKPAVSETGIPLFQIFLDRDLLDKLTARAKAEYRTPELEAAYILHKELSA
jgi:hypothetical protein